MIGKIKIQN